MLIEIAGDELYFQTLSRVGVTVDSGMIQRVAKAAGAVTWPAIRPRHGGPPDQTLAKAFGAGLTSAPTAAEWPLTTIPSPALCVK